MKNIRWLAPSTYLLVCTIVLAAPSITVGQKLPPTTKIAQQPDQMPDMQTATPPPQGLGGQSAGAPEHAQASGPGVRLEDLEQMALNNNRFEQQAVESSRLGCTRIPP